MAGGGKPNRNKTECFLWTDDEVELLLHTTNDYKVSKAAQNIDWEAEQSKYTDIFEQFTRNYPSAEAKVATGKDFPHKKEDITKNVLITKLKGIRCKYRKAADEGRRSGHGRVVLLYFELCQDIWGGSRAAPAIATTVDTSRATAEDSPDEPSPPESTSTSDTETAKAPEAAVSDAAAAAEDRRAPLNTRLKRKVSTEGQLLAVAQEDVKIKKRLLAQMETTKGHFVQNMDRLTTSIEKLTQSVCESFDVLKQMMSMQQGQSSSFNASSQSPHDPDNHFS